jgi:co-chaperonin GroES (HSP10)
MEKKQQMLTPLSDQVAVIRDDIEKTTESGIVLTEGRQVVPGSGVVFATGQYVDEVKEGDKVYFSAMKVAKEGRTVEIENQEFLIIPQDDLWCVVKAIN